MSTSLDVGETRAGVGARMATPVGLLALWLLVPLVVAAGAARHRGWGRRMRMLALYGAFVALIPVVVAPIAVIRAMSY